MDISGSTVLVTGGAGLVGSHLADALLPRGCRVRILDSLEPHSHPYGAPDWIPSGADFIHGSVLNGADLEQALRGVDFVFHESAFTGFDHHATPYMDMNARAVAALFDAIASPGFSVRKVVVASSLSVY